VIRYTLLLPLLMLAQPALAQHDNHAGHQSEAPPAPEAPPAQHDHSAMDHGQPDQSHAGHTVPSGDASIPEAPPPPEALSGPLHAADAAIGAEAMAAARKAGAREMGGMGLSWFQADRLEARAHSGKDGFLWDLQGFIGGDIDKLWLKSEGEGAFSDKPEHAEVQALWSHAVDPWWDVQLGLRQDLIGPDRTHAVIGIQGLAPYEFEVDAALFVSTKGDVTARIEVELDQRITQRLILQPRSELGLAAQDVPELGIGAGLDHAELGLRLRYEITRQFAPYVGVEHERKFGQSARYARAAGEDPIVTSVVMGIRFWF
jgi:copper resistance protein B